MVYYIGLERYRYWEIRVCDKVSRNSFVLLLELKTSEWDILNSYRLINLSPNLMNLSCVLNPPKTGFK